VLKLKSFTEVKITVQSFFVGCFLKGSIDNFLQILVQDVTR